MIGSFLDTYTRNRERNQPKKKLNTNKAACKIKSIKHDSRFKNAKKEVLFRRASSREKKPVQST